jgi:hypothetical protein
MKNHQKYTINTVWRQRNSMEHKNLSYGNMYTNTSEKMWCGLKIRSQKWVNITFLDSNDFVVMYEIIIMVNMTHIWVKCSEAYIFSL